MSGMHGTCEARASRALFEALDGRCLLTAFLPDGTYPADPEYAGRSDSGNFVFSEGGGGAWVIIDGQVGAMADVPGVGADGVIEAVNDFGLIAGRVAATGELFLVKNGVRVMLDDAILSTVAPPGVTRDAVNIRAVANDGTVLMNESTSPQVSRDVWVLDEGVAVYLWTGYGFDINASGVVVGRTGGSYSNQAMRRRADGVVEELQGLTSAKFVNTAGDILGTHPWPREFGGQAGVLWRNGEVETVITWTAEEGLLGLSDSGAVLGSLYESRVAGRFTFVTITTLFEHRRLDDIVVGGVGPYDPESPMPAELQLDGSLVIWTFGTPRYRPVDDSEAFAPAPGAEATVLATDSGVYSFIETVHGAGAVLVRTSVGWTGYNIAGLREALGLGAGDPLAIKGVYAFANPHPGESGVYALIVGAAGVAVVDHHSSSYVARNVWSGSLVGGSVYAVGGWSVLVGANADGDLIRLAEGPSIGENWWEYHWTLTNLSEVVEANGQTVPPVIGSVTTFVTAWNAQNIAYLDGKGNVQVVWVLPGKPTWRIDNLTALTGSPALHGNLVSYITPWHGQNVTATDADGNLVSLWWAPGMSVWRNDRLVGGVPAQFDASTISGFSTPWGGLNVVGLDKASGKLTAYWWAPGKPAWVVEEFKIKDAPADLRLTGRVSAVVAPDGRMFIAALTDQNHIASIRIGLDTGLEWTFEDVTGAL